MQELTHDELQDRLIDELRSHKETIYQLIEMTQEKDDVWDKYMETLAKYNSAREQEIHLMKQLLGDK